MTFATLENQEYLAFLALSPSGSNLSLACGVLNSCTVETLMKLSLTNSMYKVAMHFYKLGFSMFPKAFPAPGVITLGIQNPCEFPG